MPLNRRDFLLGSTLTGVATIVPIGLRQAIAGPDGFIELRAEPAKVRLLGAGEPETELWTYNGTSPGQEIRVKRGERVKVRLINNLDQPTTIHWHGIRIDNAMDGVPDVTQPAVKPGDSFEYDFVAPDAGTYFYHTHERSWEQMARGLYGVLIVEEDQPVVPRDRDLTLVIDDWRFDRDGQIDERSLGQMMDWSHGGRLGNWLTVNGTSRPDIKLKTGQTYRMRLINTCNARILEFDLAKLGARIAAHDGQALPRAALPTDKPFLLAPAQRVDVLLRADEAGHVPFEEISGDPFAFMNFVYEDAESAASDDILALPANNIPEPDLGSALSVDLLMEGGAMGGMRGATLDGQWTDMRTLVGHGLVWAFNGEAGFPKKPLFSVKRGQTVIMRIENRTSWPHAMHMHGFHFKILERNGQEDSEKPWRDTFLSGAQGSIKIAFVADNPGKWVFHCHMLEHVAAGMITWFEVT